MITFLDGFTLLSYLESLSLTDDIDFTVLEQLLEGGENINTLSESMGQCIMHEVAANWDQSVAEFFLKKGSDIHLKDKEGKTPLHVAASTGHTDMVEWLIENGAELEPRTIIERQTPLHHAARYDAVQAMGILIEHGGNFLAYSIIPGGHHYPPSDSKGDCEVRDYKGRTPLHLAAELDRTAAAEYLISVPISAEVRVQDDHGNHAIASMIRTMPRVVRLRFTTLH